MIHLAISTTFGDAKPEYRCRPSLIEQQAGLGQLGEMRGWRSEGDLEPQKASSLAVKCAAIENAESMVALAGSPTNAANLGDERAW